MLKGLWNIQNLQQQQTNREKPGTFVHTDWVGCGPWLIEPQW